GDLGSPFPWTDARKVDVGERVVAELEALPMEGANEGRVAHDLAADREERRGDVESTQDGGDARGPARIRTIVEGERHPAAGRRLPRGEAFSVPAQDRAGTRKHARRLAPDRRSARPCRPRRKTLCREGGDERSQHQ